MFKNYFTTAVRHLFKNKSFSFINILGLAIGMASALLILLWVQNEMSFDRFYTKTARIYKIYNRDKVNGAWLTSDLSPSALATSLHNDFPEVENAVRYRRVTFLTSVGEKHINSQGAFADEKFLDVFDFPLSEGERANSLSGNYSIVITKKFAEKLFGNESAIGKTIKIDSTDNFTVKAVLEALPSNTQFDFEYLLPWTYMVKLNWVPEEDWFRNFAPTYVCLKEGTKQSAFEKKIQNLLTEHNKSTPNETTAQIFLQPIKDTYLYSKSENGRLVAGKIEAVKIFIIIAIFILLIACINFMNLSTARSEKRAKEVGIRKVMGGMRTSLALQFIFESILISAIAFAIALIIVQVALPAFDKLIGSELKIDFNNPYYWAFAVSFVILTGILAGSYPAFYLSSFNSIKVLKGSFRKINSVVTPRKVLVILQFTFAIVLIISTIIVQQQVKYAQERESGYNRSNLIFTFTQGKVNDHFRAIKDELIKSGAAVAVTKSYSPITRKWNDGDGFYWQGSTEADKKINFAWLGSDADFTKTLGVKIAEGRDIDVYNYPTDTMGMLLNEEAVRLMRLKNPIGQTITFAPDGRQWHVVGVVKNFILESPYSRISPMMIVGPSQYFQVMHIKLNPANSVSDDLAKAEKIFKDYNPQYPFEYVFADEAYAGKYKDEKKTETLSRLFAGLTIFISCLGLFGLAAYMAENRVKEIGVRKVLGATTSGIAILLSRDFLKLILISIIIGSPIAYFAMAKWLSNYEYRTEIRWWIFAGSGLIALLIAIITISFQAIRAALENPVKSLRSE
ncbi:MAG: ABC transporter permease [Bacteroidetes bacterium]|nr:MAG: ABC transporter permease [Bacteroidota bacterium]